MNARPRTITASIIITLAATTASHAATPRITAKRVGPVKLHQTFHRLHNAGLVGRLRPGCPFAGPNTRTARLRPPLKGHVNFTRTRPRRVTDITIRGGAKARRVGIGATIPQIQARFPLARIDHSIEPLFAVTLIRIPKADGGRIKFAVDVNTQQAVLIGIPVIAFCE